MIKNPILFIIDNNGDYLRYGGILRAINGYREFAFVISPRPLTDSVSMSIMTNNANYNRFEQYVLPTAIKVNELIEESDALYQIIADWNVFGVEIKPTALADISNFRSGATTFSFQFQTPHPSVKCVTYKGVFGVDNPLPTTGQVTGDYYECEDWNFYLTSGTQTYTFTKGMYVYFNGSRWIKDALLVELNTSTVSIPVEPSHAVGYEIDDDDANYLASIGAAAILAQQTAEQSAQDVEDLKDGTTPIFFDKTGTDLDAGFIEEAIKEVNVKTNANKQNIEKIVDGTTIVKKAEQDKNGNDIVTTYETKSDATRKLSLKADKTYVDSQDQALDDKIDLLDERVEDLEIANMIKSYTYNPTTHVITFTYYDNTTTSFDLPLESAIVSASYDDTTQNITFVLQSGATLVVPLDDLVSGLASETWVNTYFIPKTAIVDNLTTDDATKVLSAKQGKALQDTKEAIANKKSVINDSETEYPNSKATLNLVKDIGLDTPIKQLENQTLREVFGGGNKHTSYAQTDGVSNGITFTRSTYPIFNFDGTSTASDTFSLPINMLTGNEYYIRYTYISGSTNSSYIETSSGQMLFSNLSVNGSVKFVNSGTITRYVVTNGGVSSNMNFKIEVWKINDLGISDLTATEMDYLFNMYQEIEEKSTTRYIIDALNSFDGSKIIDETIGFEKTNFIEPTKNLFDKNNVVEGFIDLNNGIVNISSSYKTTNYYIEMKNGVDYTINTSRKVALYNTLKVLQTADSYDNSTQGLYTFTAPFDGYFRISVGSTNVNDCQVETGSEFTTFVPFGIQIPSLYIDNGDILKDKILLNLGDSIAQGNGGTSYAHIIALEKRMKLYSKAVGGATLGDATPDRSYIKAQYDTFKSENPTVTPDYILIDGGTNDIFYNTLGSVGSGYEDTWDETKTLGGLECLLENIKNDFPSSKVLFVFVHNMNTRDYESQLTWYNGILSVLNKWSIPYADIYKNGNLNTNIVAMRIYTDTGTHPTTEGYEKFYVPIIKAKLYDI